MGTTFVLRIGAILAFALAAPVAIGAENISPAPPKWLPELEVETDVGIGHNSRDIGLPKMMAPLWQDDKSMLFTDLRYKFDNEQSEEYNLGLGYRREINASWILGGYGFFDKLSSKNGNLYSQGTFGLEALRVNNEARVNVYIPENTQKTASGSAQVMLSGSQLSVLNGFERALPGADFELGQKLPFNFADVRAYAGGYRFAAEGYGIESGPRGRLEFTLNDRYVPSIPFGAQITLGEIEHDQIRGTQSFAVLKLRIPFGGSSTPKDLDPLEERMTRFIQRDVDVITHSGGSEPAQIGGNTIDSVNMAIAGNTFRTKVASSSPNTLILIDGSGGPISYGSNVISSMQSGQVMLGGGTTVAVTGARSGATLSYTFPGTAPTVNGMGKSNSILALADNVWVQNITFVNMTAPVSTFGASNVTVRDLTLNIPLRGITIQGSTNVNISNVTINNSSFDAIVLDGTFGPSQNIAFSHVAINNSGINGILASSNPEVHNLSFNNVSINGVAANGFEFDGAIITGLSGSGNSTTGITGVACNQGSASISGSFTYNGSSTCP